MEPLHQKTKKRNKIGAKISRSRTKALKKKKLRVTDVNENIFI